MVEEVKEEAEETNPFLRPARHSIQATETPTEENKQEIKIEALDPEQPKKLKNQRPNRDYSQFKDEENLLAFTDKRDRQKTHAPGSMGKGSVIQKDELDEINKEKKLIEEKIA
jgi:hypothetical protein